MGLVSDGSVTVLSPSSATDAMSITDKQHIYSHSSWLFKYGLLQAHSTEKHDILPQNEPLEEWQVSSDGLASQFSNDFPTSKHRCTLTVNF
jgi:hypothetical protein